MKKIIVFCLIFLFFTGCVKQKGSIDEVNNSVASTQFGLPLIITTNFSDIQEVKNALDTLSEEKFQEYMYNNKLGMYVNGMYDKESTKNLLSEIYSTTFAFLDDEISNTPDMQFYHERNDINMAYELSKTKRITFYFNTPKKETNAEELPSNIDGLIFEKEIEKDGAILKIFSSANDEKGVRGLTEVDGTVIFFRVNQKQTIEEFEQDLARFTFAKIDDMIAPLTDTDVKAS